MGDHRGGMGEQMGQMTMSVGPQKKNRLADSSEGLKELLPGIPDSITLTHIAPKLPWRAVRILSLVSVSWQQRVHSREVYKARIRAGSTETFVVLRHTLPESVPRGDGYSVYAYAISVYSVEDKRCYQLPAIPGVKKGIPSLCQCISLNGKVYILGGNPKLYDGESRCAEVYELDVAGKWEWNRCPDMQHGRQGFACGVMDEHIYVFGGRSGDFGRRHGAEVYDPRADTWSSIVSETKLRHSHQTTTLGEELVVHGGDIDFDGELDFLDKISYRPFDLDVYHPGRDEWRVVMRPGINADYEKTIYFAHGKLHLMTADRIDVLDIDTHEYTLTYLNSSLLEFFGPLVTDPNLGYVEPLVARVVNGELLALVRCYDYQASEYNVFLLQSEGFGSENRELEWEKIACSLSFSDLAPIICPIQL